MAMSRTIRWLGVLALVGMVSLSRADDPPATESPSIDKLIKQLESRQFTERQAASQALTKAGEKAIPALTKAATNGNREVMTRSLDILRKHYQGGNETIKQAAKEALQKIGKSDKPFAAQRADEILNPKPPQPPQRAVPFGVPLQIQIRAIGGQGRQIQIRNVNGVKEINAEEGGVKVKIEESPNKGIKMEVTEKKDGKKVTKKYEAKNADELKKKHPEAYKLYDKYTKRQPVIRNIRIQPQRIQIRPGRGFRRLVDPTKAAQELEQARQELQKATKKLKDLSLGGEAAKQLEASVKQLEEASKQLEKALSRLK